MFKIDTESLKKLVEINNLLNKLEIRGISNIEITYNCMIKIQEIIKQIDDSSKNDQGIIIDNTRSNGG
jgi:hypothetical protein